MKTVRKKTNPLIIGLLTFTLIVLVLASIANTAPEDVANTDTPKEPLYIISVENMVTELYGPADFSALSYQQTNPGDDNLYYCRGTFKDKVYKIEHSYFARIGYNTEANSSTIYFLSVDADTIYWDEDGEIAFLDK